MPVAEPEPLRAALAAANGVSGVVVKRAGCCCGRPSGSTSTRSSGLGSFLELEAVAATGLGPDARARAGGAAARRARHPRRGAGEGSYADAAGGRAAPDPELLALARAAVGNAYAPYSDFPVGAAVRTDDGRRYAGANVENAAYPQGQCAEASAIGALVAGGGGRIAEVVVAAPSRELCTPCGGCRQRLREFTADDAPIHLADLERVRRTTSLGELLPLSFGPEHLAA